MILKLFSQFDDWGPHRLVWQEKAPEGQAGVTDTAKKAPALPKTPEELAREAAASQAKQADAGAKVKEAAKAGLPDPAAAEDELSDALNDTAQGAGGTGAVTIADLAESREATGELTDIKSFFKRIIVAGKKELKPGEAVNFKKIIEKMQKEIGTEEMKKTEGYFNEHMWDVTRQDEEDFRNKFSKDNTWDVPTIMRQAVEDKLTNKELISLLFLPGPFDSIYAGGTLQEFRTKNKERLEAKRRIEDFAALVAKPQYKEAYEAFQKDPTDENQETLLALFPAESEDRKLAEWGLTAPPNEAEKYYVRTQVLKGKKLAEEEINNRMANGTLGTREGFAALAILQGGEAEEDAAQAADTLQDLGWFAGIEKFFEQLMAWFEKFTQGLEKKVTGWEVKAASKERFSPLGEGAKIAAGGYEEGKGIAFRAPKDTELMAIRGPGEISQIDDGVAVTFSDKSRVEYHGVKIKEGADGTTVKGGQPVATALDAGPVRIQTFGPDEKETDPAKEISRFISNP